MTHENKNRIQPKVIGGKQGISITNFIGGLSERAVPFLLA